MGPTERLEEAAIEDACKPDVFDIARRVSAEWEHDLSHDYVSESETERYWREQNEASEV